MSFNYKDYKLLYKDLSHLNTEDELVDHYINYGLNEGRKMYITDDDYKYINNIDWRNYIEQNHDLNIASESDAWKHWLTHGKKEGRKVIFKNEFQTKKPNKINISLKKTNDENDLQKLYDNLKIKYDKLSNSNKDLKHLKEQIENLKKIETSSRDKLSMLKKENQRMTNQNLNLKKTYEKVLKETNAIIKQNNRIENNIIIKEIHKLCSDIFNVLFFDQYSSYKVRELLFSPKTIYGLYYIKCIDNYIDIVKTQIFFLKKGLMKVSNKILVFITCYDENKCEELETLLSDNKFILFKTKNDLDENYAFNMYHKHLENDNYYLYYFNTCLTNKLCELDSKLDSKLVDKLDCELNCKLDGELYCKLDGKLNGKLNDGLYCKLDGELYSEKLETKLNNFLNFYTLKLFDLNIELLDKYDFIVSNINPVSKECFTRNFWWSKSSYLNKLKKIENTECDSYIMKCPDQNFLSFNKINQENDLLDLNELNELSRVDILSKSHHISKK